MDPTTVGLIGLAVMVFLILAGVHIGVAMGVVGFVGVAAIISVKAAFGVFQTVPYSTIANYSLSIVLFFVFMGQVAFHSGLSYALYNAAYRWLGHLPGGLAMSTVVACTAIGALCGSSPATTATMGVVALPEMKKFKYDGGLAAATVACSGTLGIMVPPSVLLMLYGIMASQSISKLFMAVIVPGMSLMLFFMLAIYFVVRRNPALGPSGPRFTWKERFVALYEILDLVVLIMAVIGGMLTGMFTVNEGGAVGALGAMIVAALRKKINVKMLLRSLYDTGKVVAMVFAILVGAMVFGYFLAVTQLPTTLAEYFATLPLPRHVILLGIIALYLFLGCIMDELAMLLLTVPIFYPVILSLHFDPIWFGVMLVLIMASGLICPPVGLNCFIIAGIDKSIPLATVYKGIVPFWLSIVAVMILVTIFPELCLFLPKLLL